MAEQRTRVWARGSIRQRISAVIVISIIGAVLLCMVSTFIIMRRQMLVRTETSAKKDLQMVCEKLDLLIDQVERDAVLILASDSCQSLLRRADIGPQMDYWQRNQLYRAINENMVSMVNSQNTYRSVAFYDTNATAFMVGNMVPDAQGMEEKQREIISFISQPENMRWQTLHESPWVQAGKWDEARDCISYLRKVYAKESGNLLGVMELELNNAALLRLYSSVAAGGNELYMLDGGTVVSSSVAQALYETFSGNAGDMPVKHIDANMSAGKAYFYNSLQYAPLGWSVVLATAQAPYRQELADFASVYFVMSILLLAVILLLSNRLVQSIIRPIEVITGTIQQIGKGDYKCKVSVKAEGELKTMADEFNRMVDEMNDLMARIRSTEQQKRQSELSLIQMQITPHFFYNILESICGLIVLDEKSTAIQTIQCLSDFYRGVLGNGKEIIGIQEELTIAKHYLQMMQICYPDTFSYSVSVQGDLGLYCICKLTLQPILENAIHHGIVAGGCRGHIEISVERKGDDIEIRIRDDGVGMSRQALQAFHEKKERTHSMDSFGVKNTDDRIKLYFGAQYGLSIESWEQAGTEVTMLLPAKTAQEQ